MSDKPKVYLGDGVYAEYSGYDITLTTTTGIGNDNTIYVDYDILQKLVKHARDWGILP